MALMKEIKRCNDSLDSTVAENFPHIRQDLQAFKKMCGYYEAKLQKDIEKKLLEDRDKSPFSQGKLNEWLEQKESDIKVLRECVDSLGGIQIVQSQSALGREVFASGANNALCLVFTYPKGGDPFLEAMAKYLGSYEVGGPVENQWHYSDEVIVKVKEKTKEFQDLAKVLKNEKFFFIVADLPNEKYKGATIYHYKKGILVTEDFSKPAVPEVETITNKEALIWYACDLTLDPKTANGWLLLSDGDKKATCAQEIQQYPDNPDRFIDKPQVLCKESLMGQHYWEVEFSSGGKQSVYVALAYYGVDRKGAPSEIGKNTKAWCVGKGMVSSKLFSKAYHNGKVWETSLSPDDFSRVGVFLDWPAGTLSFYKVISNTLSHIYTFRTKFSEPLYPVLWANHKGNFAYLNLAD